MMLRKRTNFFTPAQFALASAGCLGTTQRYRIDRQWPIEELILIVTATCNATGPGTLVAPDNLLRVIKRVTLNVNDGAQPRATVDFSGPGLLEYASLVGANLDRTTLDTVRLAQGSSFANSLVFRLAYRIPIVHPLVGEPIRSRMLLPCHVWGEDPELVIDFESAANMYGAGALDALTTEVVVIRREMPDALTADIQKSGGFIPFDLIETPFAIAPGVSGEQRFAIPTPGSYANLLLRHYLGGATVTRAPLDQTTTAGAESRWRLESGGVVQHEWRNKHLQIINDWSRPANDVTQTSSPNFAGAVAANTNWQPASSLMLDFLTDALDTANELGSVLDCNIPANRGLKMELIGPVASVATNASTLYLGGHRYFGDLSRWQALRSA